MNESIVSKTIGGLKWNYISVILTSVFQLLHLTIMARLLDKADFGLLAMAEVVLRFGVYFSRMGIGSAIIQKKNLSDEDIRAGFTLSVLLSVSVTMIIVAAAPLGNLLFDNLAVIPIIRVYAFTMLIAGFNIVAVSLLRRTFRFRELFIAEVFSYFIGAMAVGITLAYLGWGVWSLVIASLVQGTVLTLITYAFARHPTKLFFSTCHYRSLLSFGGRVSLISFFEYINYNLDTILIGRFFGDALLGIYNQANRLINLPSQKISTSLIQVLFPTLSELQDDHEKVRRAHLFSLEVLGLVLFPFAFSISGAAHEVVLVLLGNRWLDTIPILRILAIATPFFILNSINGILFEAKIWLKIKIKLVLTRLVGLILLFLLLLRFGIIGISVSILVISIIDFGVFSWVAQKRLEGSVRNVTLSLTKIVGFGVTNLALTWMLSMVLKTIGLNIFLIFFFQMVTVGTLLVIFFLFWPTRTIILFFNQSIMNVLPASDIFFIKHIKNRYQRLYKKLS